MSLFKYWFLWSIEKVNATRERAQAKWPGLTPETHMRLTLTILFMLIVMGAQLPFIQSGQRWLHNLTILWSISELWQYLPADNLHRKHHISKWPQYRGRTQAELNRHIVNMSPFPGYPIRTLASCYPQPSSTVHNYKKIKKTSMAE